ncbi:MAG: response regulator, partial [Nitrospiraceae bacterium]
MNDNGKRLLLIEDDHDIRRLLRDLFTQEGYHVCEARDGSEALVEMDKRRFDVVLSDDHMPRMDGLTFLDISTHLCPETPVIL